LREKQREKSCGGDLLLNSVYYNPNSMTYIYQLLPTQIGIDFAIESSWVRHCKIFDQFVKCLGPLRVDVQLSDVAGKNIELSTSERRL
jgi:hypothetical protein